jgi:hypothetical protein
MFEGDTYVGFQIDHIISEKHGGPTTAENLALACLFCNVNKGSDIGSRDDKGAFVRLYNPRMDPWADHFAFRGAIIEGLTAVGTVTARLLRFNEEARIEEREATISL